MHFPVYILYISIKLKTISKKKLHSTLSYLSSPLHLFSPQTHSVFLFLKDNSCFPHISIRPLNRGIGCFCLDSLFKDVCTAISLVQKRWYLPLGKREDLFAVKTDKDNVSLHDKGWAGLLKISFKIGSF